MFMRFDRKKGKYEIMDGNKMIHEVKTMEEAKQYIENNKSGGVKLKANKRNVGFGEWGTPTFMMFGRAK